MWATPEESRADLVALYRRVWAHSDATVDGVAARRRRPGALVAAGAAANRPCTGS